MANLTLSKLITILSLAILLLLPLYFQIATSFQDDENDDEVKEYIVDEDDPIYVNPTNGTSRSRFLRSVIKTTKIAKGAQCDVRPNPYAKHNSKTKTKPCVCNGVWANKGRSLLFCCQKHCQDVLSDGNNCGRCGHRCRFGERCCGGVCVNVLRNKNNCGKCNKKCRRGVKCEYGYCGYA